MSKKKHIENSEEFKALKVNKGISQPSSFNPDILKNNYLSRKKILSANDYLSGILEDNRVLLSQAITLLESSRPDHQEIASEIVNLCLPHAGKSVRIGVTGVPGVGKSTLIEVLGKEITAKNEKVAVLAIDPSSEKTRGSILGDKTRMELLANDRNAYIRPSPSAGTLGGVARKTRETIILCEAAGFSTIFVETVGVGQSETAVYGMTDFFLLLMLAGAGDELQGIKRGIMEMADCIAITKSEGDNIIKSQRAKSQYENALHLFPATKSGWNPCVLTCSAVNKTGVKEIIKTIDDYRYLTEQNGYFAKRRSEQAKYWYYESINDALKASFYTNPEISERIKFLEKEVVSENISSHAAATQLINLFLKPQ
ncbi:MAG: methylmalonyl Co-A mutase-associated GTPase MeaB [Bacteroidales bacterium]|nr:methylmalonyl Co-A mutase-associated GTPase MeaB [Bacteroidales bacterium]